MESPEKSNPDPVIRPNAEPTPLRRFVILWAAFSLALFGIMYWIEPALSPHAAFPGFAWIQAIVMVATLAIHYGTQQASRKGNQAFVRFFMAATGFKLLAFLSIMVVYSLLHKESAFGFILHFFLYYLFYTALEVTLSYRSLSRS